MRIFTLSLCLAVAACNGGKGESTGTTDSEGTSGATTGTTTGDGGNTTPGSSQSDTTPPLTTTEADTSTATTDEVTGPGPVTMTTEGETATTTTGSDSTTGDPGPPLTISLLEIAVFADCMPVVAPDNVHGTWTVLYDNTAGAADGSAELVSATLTLQGDVPLPFELEVEPTDSGPVPAGQTTMQEQTKQEGLVPVAGCSHCDKPYDLDLVFKTGGEEVLIKTSDILTCAL